MRRALLVVVGLVVVTAVLAAVGPKKALYIGGTLAAVPEKTEGVMVTTSDTVLVFQGDKGKARAEFPYAAITELEYGQKASRRVAMAITISPWALFSKKRVHFLTLTFKDAEGKEQAAVFELGKDVIRPTLKILEVRTGKEVVFQDVEACKQYKLPKECESGK